VGLQFSVESPGIPAVNVGPISIQTRTSLMIPVITVALLVGGLAITGVGIWSSIPPGLLVVSPAKVKTADGNTDSHPIRGEAGTEATEMPPRSAEPRG
jgi:hypothetical protein